MNRWWSEAVRTQAPSRLPQTGLQTPQRRINQIVLQLTSSPVTLGKCKSRTIIIGIWAKLLLNNRLLWNTKVLKSKKTIVRSTLSKGIQIRSIWTSRIQPQMKKQIINTINTNIGSDSSRGRLTNRFLLLFHHHTRNWQFRNRPRSSGIPAESLMECMTLCLRSPQRENYKKAYKRTFLLLRR